jgi:hypothetical protein
MTERTGNEAGLHSLERLRDRVELAARELERLRQDNRELADRVAELETTATGEHHPAMINYEEPEAMRRKVQGFIDAIDRVLSSTPAPEDTGTADAPDA